MTNVRQSFKRVLGWYFYPFKKILPLLFYLGYAYFMVAALIFSRGVSSSFGRYLENISPNYFADITRYSFSSRVSHSCTASGFEMYIPLLVFLTIWVLFYFLTKKILKNEFSAHIWAATAYVTTYASILLYERGAFTNSEKIYSYRGMGGYESLNVGWPAWDAVIFSMAIYSMSLSVFTFFITFLFLRIKKFNFFK